MAPSPRTSDQAADNRIPEIARDLYTHQIDGVAFLLARRKAILADDMGLGKTRQSILAMHHSAPGGPCLIVCPASVKSNWRREIETVLGPATPVVVVGGKVGLPESDFLGWVVINYDILPKHAAGLTACRFAGIVFDEAHYLKNYRSKRSRAARSLIQSTPSEPLVHCLTGTPMTNRPRDLFPLLQLVEHPLGKSFLSFAKRYCDAYRNEYGWVTEGASNIEELTVQLHGTMLRRRKEDVLDLPPKNSDLAHRSYRGDALAGGHSSLAGSPRCRTARCEPTAGPTRPGVLARGLAGSPGASP